MPRGLPISTFVNISTAISAGGVPRQEFGAGLLLTLDDSLPAGGPNKVQRFSTLEQATAVLGSGQALDAATVWFSADPRPKGLHVGRWATVDVATTLRGGSPAALDDLKQASASFRVFGHDVTVDLSGDSSLTEIAAGIQAAIRAADTSLNGVTFAYDTDAFLMTAAGAEDLGFLSPHSGGAGTDISGLLAMQSGSAGAVYKQGHDAETAVEAIQECISLAEGGAPVALMLAPDAPLTVGAVDTRETVAAFAQGGDYVFGLLDTSDQALVTGDATSQSALVFSRQQSHVEPVYSVEGELPEIGLLALMSSQNLDQPQSVITPHLKALPGVAATPITETQRAELERKRTNVYTTVGGLPALVGGFTGKAGSWLDAVWWLLWLKNRLELGIFNAQRASRRFNTAILNDTVSEVMQLAVQSGGAQPGGTVNSTIKQDIISTTGNLEFDGTLAAGYLSWIARPSQRTAQDREARVSRFKVWIAPADAIHHVLGDIVLSG